MRNITDDTLSLNSILLLAKILPDLTISYAVGLICNSASYIINWNTCFY